MDCCLSISANVLTTMGYCTEDLFLSAHLSLRELSSKTHYIYIKIFSGKGEIGLAEMNTDFACKYSIQRHQS